MVSSGESNTKSIDASVGGLVWVRRRNGSWWPGRIMDLDELSANCLVSPKSGTPVKLLGREDASVDWYNLEKSKRVKAFRCGEYDKCIEKAKASAANSSKKAVKYARREDAILHALEIESGLLSKDRLDFCSRTENACGEDSGTWAREYRTVSHSCEQNEDMAEEVSTFEENSNSTQEISQSGLSFEEPNQISSSKVQFVQGKRRRTPNDSEDDGTEGIKRMRGLEDLGMGVLTKRMSQDGRDLDLIQEDNASPCDSNTGNSLSIGSYLNGSKGDHLSWSRKRSQVVNVHESVKRKNRRRPLTKVLESTAMVSVPVLCNELASPCRSPLQEVSENKVFGLETNEPETSFLVAVYNSSDSTECKNATEIACDVSPVPYKIKENDISSISELPENAFPDTLFDVPFVGEEKQCAGFPTVYRSCSSGKPQASGQSSQAETVSLKNEEPIESGSTCSAAAHINNISQSIEKGTSKWKSKGKRKSRRSRKNKKQDLRKFVDMAGVEDMDGFLQDSICRVGRENHIRGIMGEPTHQQDYSLKSQKLLPYRESRYTIHPKYQTSDFPTQNCHADSFLYDVPLEVKASYRPQHVPLVSLMSKLNGKAIVGHPLTIEVLTEGSCDYPVNENVNDAMTRRIPTKHPSKQARSSPSKPPKLRKCGIMSKKTRKLSSLTGSQMQSEEDRKLVIEKPKGPVISCIPLSVVFSRLNEAVSGSTRPPNGC